jgi:single-strand DNA-binding protein
VINSCVLTGRIVNDPEMKYSPSGTAITKFRLAVERRRGSQDGQEKQTDFLDIVTFQKTAELVAQYMDKGAMIGVEGRIQSRTWETQDGQKRYSVEIVANNVTFLESKQEAERRRGARGVAAPGPSQGGGYDQMPPTYDGDPFADQ